MAENLVVNFEFPGVADGERAVRMLDKLQQTLKASRGSTSALEEMRKVFVGLKGKGSVLEELASAVRGLNSATEEMSRGMSKNFDRLAKVLKQEFAELRAVAKTGGASMAQGMAEGISSGAAEIENAVGKRYRSIANKARAEATAAYQTMVKNLANDTKVDVSKLFQFREEGATLSPLHKAMVRNWERSSTETLRAIRNLQKTESNEIKKVVEAENAALQAALKGMAEREAGRRASLSTIYADSLARGKFNTAQIRSNLKAEAASIKLAVAQEEEALQTALKGMQERDAMRRSSLSTIYANSIAQGKANINIVRNNLKQEAALIKTTVAQETDALQAALKSLEDRESLRRASLSEIYANSLARGKQSIARVKAELRNQGEQVAKANLEEFTRIQAQVKAATMQASGVYSTISTGKVIDPREVNALSKSLRQLTIDGNDAHSMARGLASGFNLLWLTWGNLLPLFTGAGISFGLKKTFDIGSEIEYSIKMMEILGQTTIEGAKKFEGAGTVIRAELRAIDQTTLFSMTELAQAMVRLGQAGLTPREALQTLRPAADLAAVGMTDLKTSTDLLIQTMALFGKTSKDAGKIAAQIFEITKSGVLNVEDISGSMKYASEINTRFQTSLEETLTLLGALAQAGLKGSSGGTALINFMRDLAGRSGPSVKALKELEKATKTTIETFDQAGKMRSPIAIFQDIAKAADQLKAKDADKLLAKIFSDRGGRLFFAMIRDGTVNLDEMVKKLGAVKPENLFMAAKGLMETTKGALDILKSTLVGALDEVFEANADKFKQFIIDITKVIDSDGFKQSVYGMVSAVGALYEGLKTITPAVVAFGGAWLTLKAISIGTSIIQSIAMGLAAMAPVLAMTEKQVVAGSVAWWNNTRALQANGVAAIENAAAQRALATGASTAAAAAGAAAAAQAATATTAMTWLARAIGFLAHPIVGIGITLATLGASFWAMRSSASKALDATTDSIVSNGKINMEQWNKEIQTLRTRNALLGTPFADQQQKIGVAESALNKLRDDEADQQSLVNSYGKIMTYAQSQQVAKLRKLTAQREAMETDVAAMKANLDGLQNESQTREMEEEAKRQRQAKKAMDDASKIGVNSPGATKGAVRELRIANDVAMQEISRRQEDELNLLKSGYDKRKQITDAQHQANLISDGEYQAQLFQQAQQYENNTLASLNRHMAEYEEAYTNRRNYLAKLTKDTTDPQQLERLAQEFKNVAEARETFLQKNESAKVKVAEESYARIQLALIKLEGEYEKASKAEDDYWKKEQDETNKLKALQAVENQYRFINDSVFSFDVAQKEAARTAASETEKVNAHVAQLTRQYKEAEAAANDFFLANAGALMAADGNALAVYSQLLTIQEQYRRQRQNAEVQGADQIAQRTELAFERVRQEQVNKFNNDLADAVETAIFDGGKAGGKKFVELMKNELLRKPFRMMLQATISTVTGGLMNLAASALGGGGGGGGIFGALGTGASVVNAGSTLMGAGGMMGGFMNGLSAWGAGGSVGTVLGNPGLYTGMEMIGAASPILLGAAALFALAKATKGETRSGGQYATAVDGQAFNARRGTYVPGTGATFLEGPSGGDPYAAEAKKAINNTFTGINDLFKNIGTTTRVVSLQAGYESSDKGRGGVFSGLTLNNGVTVGESGKGDNYAGTLFESTSTQSPDAKTAFENLGTDFLQLTIQSLQALTDAPAWIKKQVEGVDAEALASDAAQELITKITDMAKAVALLTKAMDGLPMANVANMTFDVAASLIELAGSVDTLMANLDTYYQNFYSEEERRKQSIKNMTKAFSDLGIPMIDLSIGSEAARNSFRQLVDSQDLSTEEGRKTYTALLALAGAFAELTPLAEGLGNAIEKLESASDDALDALEKAIDAQREVAQASYDAAQEALDNFKSIFDLLDSNIKELYNSVTQTAGLTAAQGNAVINQAVITQTLPSESVLSDAIAGARGGLDSSNFSSKFEQDIATLALAGKLSNLKDLAQSGMTNAEQQLAIAKAQLDYLDMTLKNAKEQLDVLRGIDTSITSVDTALNKFFAALEAEKAAKNPTAAPSTGGSGGGGAVFGPGTSTTQAPAKYNRPMPDGFTMGVYDASEVARLDSGMAIIQSFNDGTGNLQGMYTAMKDAGYTLGDVATIFGFPYNEVVDSAASVGIPRFQTGGWHSGGGRIVGEAGEEWEFTGPSRIWTQSQVGRAVAASGTSSNEEMTAQLAALQEDGRAQQGAIASLTLQVSKNTKVMAAILDKWDKEGLPKERDYDNG